MEADTMINVDELTEAQWRLVRKIVATALMSYSIGNNHHDLSRREANVLGRAIDRMDGIRGGNFTTQIN